MARVKQDTSGNVGVDYWTRFDEARLTLGEIGELSPDQVLIYAQIQCKKLIQDL